MLNAHFVALRVISARRAFALLLKRTLYDDPVAEVVHVESGRWATYDFDDWCDVSTLHRELEPHTFDWVRTVRLALAVPRVIRVLAFANVPRQAVKFNRRNVIARDANCCQYCGRRFPYCELSLDHVVPRSQGGPTTWENVVTSCLRCNVRKGDRTPDRAGMTLLNEPAKPTYSAGLSVRLSDHKYLAWRSFIPASDRLAAGA